MTVALAIPPLTMKNRPRALIRACAFNQKNTVIIIIIIMMIIIIILIIIIIVFIFILRG